MEVCGSPSRISAELSYLLGGVREYLTSTGTEVYACSAMAVSQVRSASKDLDKLMKEAEKSRQQEEEIGFPALKYLRNGEMYGG